MRDTYDIAVVGAGLAGLTAALVAARRGHSVALFERASNPGGRAQTRDDHGFRLNLGPHGLFGGADTILANLGIELSGGRPELGHAVRNGKLFASRIGQSPARSRIIGPRAAREFASLFSTLATAGPATLDHVSIADLLRRHITTTGARDYSLALVRLLTYVDAPELQSAGSVAFHLQSGSGVRYIDGGWQTIVDALSAAAQEAGAPILTGSRVEAIQPAAHGPLTLRLADGVPVCARAVILAVSPRDAARLVPGSAHLQSWADAAVPVEAACLDVALERLPARARRFALGIDTSLYLSTHSEWAAGLAPKGAALVSVAKYLPPGRATDAEADLRELEAFLDLAQPGWRLHRLHSRFLPAITVTNDVTSAARGGLGGRPGPAVPGLPGLYVAGDWVGGRGLLAQASLESAIAAVEAASCAIPASAPALTG